MRLRGIHIAVALLFVAIVSCRGPKLISRSEMKEIYSEMFILDQRLRDDRALKRHADTMLVYEAVFEAHGYNTDDYLYSVAHYLKDPERFAKMLKQVSEDLERKGKEIDKLIKEEERLRQYKNIKGFPLDSMLMPFNRDSIWAGAVHLERDSIMSFFLTLVPLKPDTLTLDSLKVDSLKYETDSSKISLPVDKPGADSLRLRGAL